MQGGSVDTSPALKPCAGGWLVAVKGSGTVAASGTAYDRAIWQLVPGACLARVRSEALRPVQVGSHPRARANVRRVSHGLRGCEGVVDGGGWLLANVPRSCRWPQ